MWDVLGITATDDGKAVRRAYAARLKTMDPDREPAAFQRLRAAYDWALKVTSVRTSPAGIPSDSTDIQRADLPETQVPSAPEAARPPPDPADAEHATLIQMINTAFGAGDTRNGLKLVIGGLAKGIIGMRERDQVLEAIMPAVVRDGNLTPQEYLALLHDIGWNLLPRRSDVISQVHMAALERAEAERWFLELLKTAARRNRPRWRAWKLRAWIPGVFESRAARAFLRSGQFVRLSPAGVTPLRRQFESFRHYSNWVAHRFDPARIAGVERILRWSPVTLKTGRFLLVVLGLLVIGTLAVGVISGRLVYLAFGIVYVGRWTYRGIKGLFSQD
jgi:hypothetical protein